MNVLLAVFQKPLGLFFSARRKKKSNPWPILLAIISTMHEINAGVVTIDGRTILDDVVLPDDDASVGVIGPVTVEDAALLIDEVPFSIVNSWQLTALTE